MRIITLLSDPTRGRFNEPKKRMSVTLKQETPLGNALLTSFTHKGKYYFWKNFNKSYLFHSAKVFFKIWKHNKGDTFERKRETKDSRFEFLAFACTRMNLIIEIRKIAPFEASNPSTRNFHDANQYCWTKQTVTTTQNPTLTSNATVKPPCPLLESNRHREYIQLWPSSRIGNPIRFPV